MHQRYTQLRLKYLFTFSNKCYYLYGINAYDRQAHKEHIFYIFSVIFSDMTVPGWKIFSLITLSLDTTDTGFVSLNFILLTNIKRLPLLMYNCTYIL